MTKQQELIKRDLQQAEYIGEDEKINNSLGMTQREIIISTRRKTRNELRAEIRKRFEEVGVL